MEESYSLTFFLILILQFIKEQFENLNWTVALDEFDQVTPFGMKRFTNIIATLNPNAKRRLILAAHYDSKYYPNDGKNGYFLGATDSAMPCAMLIEIAKTVTPLFTVQEQRQADSLDSDDEVTYLSNKVMYLFQIQSNRVPYVDALGTKHSCPLMRGFCLREVEK